MEKEAAKQAHSVKTTTINIVYAGMFAAVMAVLSQITIPMPSSVPITLQTFAMALTGAVLGWKLGLAATAVYILLGAVGVPVFSGFTGGFARLTGFTGGFIYGFLALTLLCGVGSCLKYKALGMLVGIMGLEICHLFGTMQYAVLSRRSLGSAFLLVSVPYQIKDIASVVLAFILGTIVRKQLLRAGLIQNKQQA